jgi:hypothetical protein
MASSRNDEREERRINLRTLVIASAASATAAVVTSQLWFAGTWIAAALTPVMVALVSELLHRPTERIADRFTANRAALRDVPPPRDPEPHPVREAEPPTKALPGEPGAAPVRVYRSSAPPRQARRRRIALGVVFGTGALALLIAVVALTVPELVAGGAIGRSNGKTTFFSRDRDRSKSADERQPARSSETSDQAQTKQQTIEEPSEQTTTEPSSETTTTTTPGEGLSDTATAPAPTTQP